MNCCDVPTELFSPNYPGSYEAFNDHTWLIMADIGIIINVQFHSFYVSLGYNTKGQYLKFDFKTQEFSPRLSLVLPFRLVLKTSETFFEI